MSEKLDSVNTFLKNFADKWYLFLVFLIVFGAWLTFGQDFTAQLSRDLVMAMLAIAGYKRATTENTTDIEKPNTVNINQPKREENQ